MLRSRAPALLLLGFSACGDQPKRLFLPDAPMVLYDKSPATVANPIAVDAEGKPMLAARMTYSADPPDVVSISNTGVAQCLRSGKADVRVEAGRVKATTSVRCHLATELTVPEAMRLDLSEGPKAIVFSAKADDGAIDNPPVVFTSENPAVVRVEYGNARPIAAGRAVIQARLGAVQRPIAIEVLGATTDAPMPDGGADR